MKKPFKWNRFCFWQKWLFYSSVIYVIAGLTFAVLGKFFPFLPYDAMVANALWGSSDFSVEAETFRAFIYIPFGGTIACCYTLLAFIAWYPFKEKKKWARTAIIAAFTLWVLVDSAGCWYFKVYPQIYLINLFSILTKALPIIFTWKDFKPAPLN